MSLQQEIEISNLKIQNEHLKAELEVKSKDLIAKNNEVREYSELIERLQELVRHHRKENITLFDTIRELIDVKQERSGKIGVAEFIKSNLFAS